MSCPDTPYRLRSYSGDFVAGLSVVCANICSNTPRKGEDRERKVSDLSTAQGLAISSGQRAAHLQRLELAIRVCELSATAASYFRALSIAGVSAAPALQGVRSRLVEFARLIEKLQAGPPQPQQYRSLIPTQLWKRGLSAIEQDHLQELDKLLLNAFDQIDTEQAEVAYLGDLAARFRRISSAFDRLGRDELGQLEARRPSAVA